MQKHTFKILHTLRDIDVEALGDIPPHEFQKGEQAAGWWAASHWQEKVTLKTAMHGNIVDVQLIAAEKKPPAILVKGEYDREVRLRQASIGGPVSKNEKAEIKQDIISRFLETTPVTYKPTPLLHQNGTALVFAGATNDKAVDRLLSYYRTATKQTMYDMNIAYLCSMRHIDPQQVDLCSFSRKVSKEVVHSSLGADFLTWLWFLGEVDSDNNGVFVEGPLVLTMPGSTAEVVTLKKGSPTTSGEARLCLKLGKKLTKATVTFVKSGNVFPCTLDENLSVSALAIEDGGPSVEEDTRRQNTLVGLQVFAELLHELANAFLDLRTDPVKWQDCLEKMQDWVEESA